MAAAARVAVVVPVLDEAAEIGPLLDHLAAFETAFEVIVADGGSTDGTDRLAREHPLAPRVLATARGRALQLNAGAAAAAAETLVFLHADSRLPADAQRSLGTAVAAGREGGNFALRFTGADAFSALLGGWYGLQRRAGIYYGDSTIWVRREVFEALGGFEEKLAIMEDYDFARRLERRGETACLPGPALTSARRWRALGVPRTVFAWVVIRWLYLAGVPSARLAALYRRVR